MVAGCYNKMKDTLCAYYTNSSDITSYMVRRLKINSGDVILEPSAGEGVFIDAILKTRLPVKIDALDIDKKAISFLKEKYRGNGNISIREADTLLDGELDAIVSPEAWLKGANAQPDLFGGLGKHYDKVIGNPPYGAWQDYKKRDLLKKRYPNQYVRETYSLFLMRCISVLKIGGRLSFIVPDTFMFLNLHQGLRELLLTATKIEEILIFPSKFFPGVSFGYSNLSIITLERAEKDVALNNTARILQGFSSSSEFNLLFDEKELPPHISAFSLKQSDILNCESHRFILAKSGLFQVMRKGQAVLGDVADVVTGFCTGDNKKYIRVLDYSIRGSKNYDKVDLSLVFPCASISGIEGVDEGYVPYIKSASRTRYCRTCDEWFVRWDCGTVKAYNSSKRARFQNSSFYFKTGVAIPMVKASSFKAFLLEGRVFDQSIVGIFPKDKARLYYILALMNSDVVNKLLHAINPTANNSANYVKQIPYLEPDPETMGMISEKAAKIVSNYREGRAAECKALHLEISKMVERAYFAL